ncbi:MAG: sugar phosphate isomerase/epimerase [Fimbriimonadaceae bacterium]|nr:sugar phosphate isomerase/epimerase [Fimbriimonadaceae bacterium]
MKIGYRTVAFTDRPLEDALAVIADAGYNAVELCLENPDLDPLQCDLARVTAIGGRLQALGLQLAAVSYHGVQDQLEVRRQRTYAAIQRLADFGAEVFVVASRREDPARLPAQWSEAVDLYRELADKCAQQHCRLAIEPQPGLVVRSAEDLVKILKSCNHPNVAANLDLVHATLSADDLSWAVFQLGSKLAHVHVADAVNGTHQHLVPGEGQIDFDEVRDVLESAGYSGPLVIDIPRSEGDPAAVCRTAREAFRSCWGS